MANFFDKTYPSHTQTKENYIETKLINDDADIMYSCVTDKVPTDHKHYDIGILVLNKNVQLLRKQIKNLMLKIADTEGDKFYYENQKHWGVIILKDKRILKKRIEELDKIAIEAIEKNMHIGFELMA